MSARGMTTHELSIEWADDPDRFSGNSLAEVLDAQLYGELYEINTGGTCDCYVVAFDPSDAVFALVDHYTNGQPTDSEGNWITHEEYAETNRGDAVQVRVLASPT